MDWVQGLLALPVVPGVPLGILLLLAVPTTAVLSRHPLRLVGFGGAMVYSLDSAVLAFALWVTMRTSLAPGADPLPGYGLRGGWVAEATAVGLVAWLPWVLGYVLAEATAAQRRPLVRAYNVALSALAGLVFVVLALAVRAGVAGWVTGEAYTPGVGPWALLAVVVASLGYVATDLLLSAVWVARVEGGRVREVLADPAGVVAAATVLAVNSTAVLAAVLLESAPWGLLLLVPVALALVHATSTGTTALTEHARAQALYRAADGCQQATTREEVVEAVVEAATSATAAPVQVRSTPPGTDQVGCRFADHEGEHWLVVGPRANRHTFVEADRAVVATLAALCEQSVARVSALDRIRYVAEHDTLTGVLDRGAFLTTVADRLTATTAVLFCDVDRFKAVNDTHGHRAGDQVLTHVARCLDEVVGAEGVVGRWGGDEFVVLLPDSSPERAEAVRSAVLTAVGVPLPVAGVELRLRLSVGVARLADLPVAPGTHALDERPGGREELAEALLERADRRMYGDKPAQRPSASASAPIVVSSP